MKIRNGFVSNSSSSSYIITINDKPKKCPHCGHEPQDILDFISRHSDYTSGFDTYINWDDIDSYLDELKAELKETEHFKNTLINRSPDELYYYSSGYQYGTVGDRLKSCTESIDSLKKQIREFEELKNQGKQIVCIEIDYHDELSNNLLNDCIDNGSITIIDEED